jgi:hypothetical protein
MVVVRRDDRPDTKAEVHWVYPKDPPQAHRPIPVELFRGEDAVTERLATHAETNGACVLDGKLYIANGGGFQVFSRQKEGLVLTAHQGARDVWKDWYYLEGILWDRWLNCFWFIDRTHDRLMKVDRNYQRLEPPVYFPLQSVSLAVGPDCFYSLGKNGALVRVDKFLSAKRDVPLAKMFGDPAPLFSAIECVNGWLYLATRPDSPVYPSHLVCVDTRLWNPMFRVDLKDKVPDVAFMTSDGEKMYLFGRGSRTMWTFTLPSKDEIAPEKTFVYLDDLRLKAIDTPGGAAAPAPAPGPRAAGAAISQPVHVDASLRQLAWVAWDETPYDPKAGSIRFYIRTADEKYFMEREEWIPVANGRPAGVPLKRYLEWRAEMVTEDPWRPPGIYGLLIGLTKFGSASVAAQAVPMRWPWLLLAVPVAGVVAYFLIGRKRWWEYRKKA